ncbi:MAG: 50S ribosomal protein L22 [Armatimonadetes bacterium]|nr:50S ribosomal protein L22 [Armatimonadota bacterium]
MEAKAIARFVRVSPRKARLVIDLVRGKETKEALAILQFTPNRAARIIEKVLKSAVANAENNNHMDPDNLKISLAKVDQGPSLKRGQPRAMGRFYRILKRTSHITIEVSEIEGRIVVPGGRRRKEQAAQSQAPTRIASQAGGKS